MDPGATRTTGAHAPSPGKSTRVADLGRPAGGVVVQRKDDKDKPKARPPDIASLVLAIDAKGTLTDEQGAAVGFRAADGKSYVAVDAKGKKAIALTAARLGAIRLGADRAILRVEEVTVAPVPEIDAISGGGTPDPKQTADQRLVAFSGKPLAVIEGDATPILQRSGDWEPIAPGALPTTLAGKLDEQVRIELDDGRTWMWMSFALGDERAETARWVPPGHSKKEVADRGTGMRAEAAKLPTDGGVKAAVDQVIKAITVIGTVEGDFNSTSGGEDTSASLGIFQWAMDKASSANAGSLGVFFRTLKARATASDKKAEKDRTDEDRLYIKAWKQCTDHKIDVTARQITIDGKAATGAEVESTMSEEMGKGSLRSYQLVAAKDWIDEFRATVVRPGPSAASGIGHGYNEINGDGTSVMLTAGRDTITIDADAPATVGSLFASEKAIANAIMLGVNRPHFVEAALWRAMSQGSDPLAGTDTRLTALIAALTPPAPAAPAGSKPRPAAAHHYTAADVAAAGKDATKLYNELRAIIWPNRALDAAAQQQLEVDFKKQALKLYSPADARRYHRERRFSTVDGSW
jgi:hypothetical protein